MSKFHSQEQDHNDQPWDNSFAEKPNTARVYDYLLGGYHNFEPDRVAANIILKAYPHLKLSAMACRAFLRRVVIFMAAQGIKQFLDIGSGIPTAGNVHEVAQEYYDDPHVVYVDIDPVAVAYSNEILQDNPFTTAIIGDVGQPREILNHTKTCEILNLLQPLGVIMVSVVHFILDDEAAYKAIKEIKGALVPGSYMAILHVTTDDIPPDIGMQLRSTIAASSIETRYRTFDQIKRFFDGTQLIEPGLVRPPLWHPEGHSDVLFDHPERVIAWSGVARID
jgi:hypothetical protein